MGQHTYSGNLHFPRSYRAMVGAMVSYNPFKMVEGGICRGCMHLEACMWSVLVELIRYSAVAYIHHFIFHPTLKNSSIYHAILCLETTI